MIVRIAGLGHYEIPERAEEEILALDLDLDAALNSGDELAFDAALKRITSAINKRGIILAADTELGAELVIPEPGASLQEVRLLLDSEAFEC